MNNYINLIVQNTSSGNFEATMLLVSFLGGLLASVSPCSLAMLPIIVGYVGGYSKEKPLNTFIQLIIFILGTSIVFTTIGILCAITGKVFISVFGEYFALIIASLLLVMGLKLLNILQFEFPVLIKAFPKNKEMNLFLYPLIIGMLFALAGTPCSTPILASIMAFASLMENLPLAILMLFLFSVGQGLILIIAGVFTSEIKRFKSFSNISNILLKISGILLIFASIYIFYKIFAPLL